MSHPLEGVVKAVTNSTVSAGAGATDVDLRPPEGCVWEILHAWGKQDDGAVWCDWVIQDTKETIADQLIGGCTGAANTLLILGATDDAYSANRNFHGSPIATYQTYFQYRFTASAGGKTGIVGAVVKEFRGVQSSV